MHENIPWKVFFSLLFPQNHEIEMRNLKTHELLKNFMHFVFYKTYFMIFAVDYCNALHYIPISLS